MIAVEGAMWIRSAFEHFVGPLINHPGCLGMAQTPSRRYYRASKEVTVWPVVGHPWATMFPLNVFCPTTSLISQPKTRRRACGVAVVSIRAGRRITSYVPLEFPTKGEYNSTNQLLARPLSVHVCVCLVVGASNKQGGELSKGCPIMHLG